MIHNHYYRYYRFCYNDDDPSRHIEVFRNLFGEEYCGHVSKFYVRRTNKGYLAVCGICEIANDHTDYTNTRGHAHSLTDCKTIKNILKSLGFFVVENRVFDSNKIKSMFTKREYRPLKYLSPLVKTTCCVLKHEKDIAKFLLMFDTQKIFPNEDVLL